MILPHSQTVRVGTPTALGRFLRSTTQTEDCLRWKTAPVNRWYRRQTAAAAVDSAAVACVGAAASEALDVDTDTETAVAEGDSVDQPRAENDPSSTAD